MRVLQPIYFYKKQITIAGFSALGFLILLNIFAVAGRNSAKATGQGNKMVKKHLSKLMRKLFAKL